MSVLPVRYLLVTPTQEWARQLARERDLPAGQWKWVASTASLRGYTGPDVTVIYAGPGPNDNAAVMLEQLRAMAATGVLIDVSAF